MRMRRFLSFAVVIAVASGFVCNPAVTSPSRGRSHGRIGARVGTSMVSTGVEVEEEVAENIVTIRPKAMEHLVQLREIQGEGMMLRMGVRSGGCSGLSYVMNLVKEDDVTADDMIEEYEGIKCVIDPKSLLYLYGLELDYSDALVGGGFQFLNPNAESSCGCGKSFGV